ncbi:MAG TPA: phytoene/squalene synthase family protein [Pirellulales bacterium]
MSDLESCYAICQRLARRSASNFYVSFLLLPREKRRAMCALYAYLRRADDLGDEEHQTVAVRKIAVEKLRFDLEQALGGQSADPILKALADTAARFKIPAEYLTVILDGVEMDLSGRRYERFEDLEEYCCRVASGVGLACIHIWGFSKPEALESARRCGIAFQLTNILRDLREDAARGRIYLPREDLARFGYQEADLMRGTVNEAFESLIKFEAARADQYYESAPQLEPLLDRDSRRVFCAMTATYRALLTKIKQSPAEIFKRRIRLSAWEKARIVVATLRNSSEQNRRAARLESVAR